MATHGGSEDGLLAPHRNRDFKVLPVKFSAESEAIQHVFYKPHRVREEREGKPFGRTMFVINVPPYCDQECVMRMFEGHGRSIESVILQKHADRGGTAEDTEEPNCKTHFQLFPPKIKGFKVAYVIFTSKSEFQDALDEDREHLEPFLLSTPEHKLSFGLKKWVKDYKSMQMDVPEVTRKINEFLAAYDEQEREREVEEREAEGMPDDEGWIKVTRLSKKAQLRTTKRKAIRRQAKRPSDMLNFYTFQIKESKMERLAVLRRKFEEDKRRIELMKASRRFKPY